MNKEVERLTDVKIMFEYYYKHKNLERYSILIDSNRIAVDNDCFDILENPKTILYIKPLKKYMQLKQENQKLNKIIDELEKFLKEGCDLTCGSGITADYKYAYENTLDKLTELKKEVSNNE